MHLMTIQQTHEAIAEINDVTENSSRNKVLEQQSQSAPAQLEKQIQTPRGKKYQPKGSATFRKMNTTHMPGVTIGTNMKDRMRLVTFKEMRQI